MTLAIGLVGCGHWGRFILRDLVDLGATVHVIAREQSTHQLALAAGAASVSSDLDTIARSADGFVVATPTANHASIIDRLLPTGRPIFVEKPMVDDIKDARRIVAAAPDRVFVMDKWRYHAGIEALADCARSGALGSVQAIRSFRLGAIAPHAASDIFWHLLPHDMAIAYEILGHLPAAQSAWIPALGPTIESLIATLQDSDGAPRVIMEIAGNHPSDRRSTVVIGSKGCAQLDGSYDTEIKVADRRPGGGLHVVERRPISAEMPLLRELRNFLLHLRGGPPPRSTASEALTAIERIAALKSLAGIEQARP